MSLTEADVKRMAHLARIEIEEQEVAPMLAQLSNIMGLVEQMQAVNTDGVAPMAHAQDLSLRLREDRVTEQDQHEAFQALAPQVEAGLYLVPKVIE
jgi:aspartyl-tRNA(Asn)/glutamyl-tRNA(Gln) amidotransferase subunit C